MTAELSATTTTAKNAPNGPAHRIIRVLEQAVANGESIGDLTDTGLEARLVQMRTALPFIPRIIVSGGALDEVHEIVESAVAAMITANEPFYDEIAQSYRASQQPHQRDAEDRTEAFYILGILVGAELAAVCQGGEV